MKLVVVIWLSYILLLVKCTPAFTNCPTSPLCVSVPVTYQCSVNTSGLANALQWSVLDATGGMLGDAVTYGSTASVGTPGLIGTQFTVNLTSIGGSSIVSDITFSPTMDINNYTVQCRGINANNLVLVGTDTCSIVIRGILPAPLPDQLTANSNYYSFSWTPQPSSPCFSSYLVFVNSSVSNVTYTTTDTSLSLPVPSTNDTEYSISVVAVDTGGRYMNSVGMRIFTPDEPPAVTNLILGQTYPDDTVNITVSWNEPPFSSRPNILSYILYHNVTDPDASITIPAPTTTYNIPDATVGSVYTVGVAAVNVLGTGVHTSAIISIISTTVPVIHSTTLITIGAATSSTRITSPTPTSTCTPTTEQCTLAEFTNCPTSPLCINEPVTYQCMVDTSGGANSLQWRVLNATGGALGVVAYGTGSSIGSMGSIGTQFTTNLTSTGASSIVSNIMFTPRMDINNYTVQCRALDTNTPAIIGGTDTCSIILKKDKPLEEKSWSVSPWSQCFPDCHRGIRNRTVVCMTVSTHIIMDGCIPPPPPSEETCYERGPCTQWVPGPWSVCSKSCGVGYQVRRIKCQTAYDSSILLNDTQCLTARPHVFRYCNIHDCPCNESIFCKLIVKTGLCWRAQYQRICRCTCGHTL